MQSKPGAADEQEHGTLPKPAKRETAIPAGRRLGAFWAIACLENPGPRNRLALAVDNLPADGAQ